MTRRGAVNCEGSRGLTKSIAGNLLLVIFHFESWFEPFTHSRSALLSFQPCLSVNLAVAKRVFRFVLYI
jgi:hypothetical protein